MTFRLRPETAAMLRARAQARGVSQTAFIEEIIERDWRAERRRLAQEGAIVDAAANEQLAEDSMAVAGEALGQIP